MRHFLQYLSLTILTLLAACTPTPSDVVKTDAAAPIYPDYRDVTIPMNIAPLNFLLRTPGCDATEVTVTVAEGRGNGEGEERLTARSSDNEVTFGQEEWKAFLTHAAGKQLTVTVTARIDGEWRQYRPFSWTVVADPIDPYLTYRLIEPDYEIYNHLQIQQRCLENFEVTPVVHHKEVGNRCMNCHTYANRDPQLSMMYVRGEGGGAVLNRKGQLRKVNIPGSVYFGFSPSGRYVVYSTNKIIPAFHAVASKRLEVYDAHSNIFVADLEGDHILHSPLLADSLKFETFPTFSPDGRYIYYCAADSVSLPQDIRRLQYALVRIAFDEQTGTFGTQVDTLVSPRISPETDGLPSKRSVCHPRISPDGRYLLYTVADYGTFPIWHPEADLRLMDLKTGQTDTLAMVNSQKSDTYHSWSSNSRWFVFASKRDDGLYGKPYFCYIDRQGHAHKPFCLPQRYPHFYDNNLKSFNAPELGRGPLPFTPKDVAKTLNIK
ncbi:MAG: hypothetical protein K5764_06585 [Prevotella sp.]|nr:hypothetical protein [Prevotella sp.]